MPLYAWTFHRVWHGSKYTLVLVLNTLLFVANIGYFVLGIGEYGVNVAYTNDPDELFMWNCIVGGGLTVANICFGEAHWLLAIFYLKMAYNMNQIVE